MSKSPPHSLDEQNPPIYNPPNPNPNFKSPENNPLTESQPSSPQIQNPHLKSPINQPHENPDQVTPSIEQSSNLLGNFDQEQNPQFQQEQEHQEQQDCFELEQANQEEEEEEEEIGDEEGINMSHSPLPKSSITKNSKLVSCSTRGNKKRKNTSNFGFQRKIQVLSEGFKPIPFMPSKYFEFSKHKDDLEKLGLWDFANTELDTNVRADLLVQLVASYKPKDRSSKVNGCSIKVSRPDMGRALKLPVKKVTGNCCEGEKFSGEFISFLEGFVSSWMLLMECDVWVTPEEVVNWMNMIKDGKLRKIDWAGIIWFMIEKELLKGKDLKNCYYASHLQQLIKHQRKDLFVETENLGVEIKKIEVNLDSDEEEGDTEMLGAKESSLGDENGKVEECAEVRVDKKCVAQVENFGLNDNVEKGSETDMVQKDCDVDMVVRVDDVSLGEMNGEVSELKVGVIDEEKNENNVEFPDKMENTDNVEFIENEEDANGMAVEDMGDFGIGRGWLMDGTNDGGQHMQRCIMTGQSGLKMLNEDVSCDGDGDGEDGEDEVGEDDDQGFNFMGTGSMDIMTSRDLVQATGHHLSYDNVELGGQSSLGLMPSTSENDVMFNHAVKREIDHDQDFSHHALNDNHKRMRMDGHWDHKPRDLDTCMGEMSQLWEKTKMAYETKKFEQGTMIQILNDQISQKEVEVMQWRCKCEEQQRKLHAEVSRRDRELHLMNSVIDGYRKALKDSQRAFAEYRKRCRIPDAPIYKDVGNGGVVRSIMELEKERVKREEEQKRMYDLLEDTFNEHIIDYGFKWEELHSKVMALDGKLVNAEKEVGQLKDDFVQRKVLVKVVMSQEVQSDAPEVQKDDFVKCEMPEDVVMSEEAQKEGKEVMADDFVERKKSEDVVMPDEGQSEAQDS